MNHAVEARGLSKRYGPVHAVRDLDLVVEPGEVYGFLGPNGAGKTTTLRMLLGLVRPSAGTVRLNGHGPGAAGHLSGVGALIEGPALYPYLSGRENLRVLARHAGAPLHRVAEVLNVVDLTERARDRYAKYSMGMKQRLGLAGALLKEPDLLILDEPTNGLDPAGMADMRRLVRRLSGEGCTILLSSHLLSEVQQVCDRVGVIADGKLVAEMPVDDIGGGRTLRIVADPIELAHKHIATAMGAERVRRVDRALEVEVGAGEAAGVNAGLVRAGVEVSELSWHEPDLEQVFMELTGGVRDAG